MLHYAQAGRTPGSDRVGGAELSHMAAQGLRGQSAGEAEGHGEQDNTVEQLLPLHTDTDADDTEKPTLAEILRAVHVCMASVNILKE